jgi:hypothetical protein
MGDGEYIDEDLHKISGHKPIKVEEQSLKIEG